MSTTTTATTGAKRYMKAKTWGKANLVREDYSNRHEYRKAAAIGFNAYKQQQEAEKAARKTAKSQPEPKQPDLSRLTKAQLLEIIAKMQMPQPGPVEERKPRTEPKPRKAAAKKTEGDGKVYFDQYSEKSVIVFGDTKPVKDTIKELGGRWNRFVETPCGQGAWFVSLSTWSRNKKAAKSINAIQYC